MRLSSAIVLALVASSGAAQAENVVINNGLAPPSPTNVVADASHAADSIWVRNVGCPPGWPAAAAGDPCPAPGASTEVSVESGAAVLRLIAHDSSTATLSGGTVSGIVRTHESASVVMTGGSVLDTIHALAASRFTWTGGSIVGELRAHSDSVIRVVGSDFRVDGAPVPYGDLTALSGTLSGTLASGESIDNVFLQGGGSWAGTVTLLESPEVPALALWAHLALAGGMLFGAAVGSARCPCARRETAGSGP